ncbi:MAG: hypothetical protein ACK4RK_11880 [Gemmataceae bacterium]
MDNITIARRLLDHARSLDAEQVNRYRLRAYRRAAEALWTLHQPVAEIVAAKGRKGLEALPGIGSHISYIIDGLVRTGEFCTIHSEKPEGGCDDAAARACLAGNDSL